MKKYAFFWLFVTLTTVFLSGCGGHWCTADNKYCIEGFNGPSRVQTFQYGVYYPYSKLIIANDLEKNGCYLSVTVDGQLTVAKINRGKDQKIWIYSNPGETRNASILVKKYCGNKYVAEWNILSGCRLLSR